jgi:pimeloyl-ACP methyl ester carboxylesterase
LEGNPGIISYYDEFLSVLHELSPSTTILGVSLAGHEDYELQNPLSLDEQLQNKVRIVDSIGSSAPFTSLKGDKPKLVVMGHSVGAYIALQTMRLRPQKVDNVFLLFPTLSHIAQGSMFGRVSAVVTSLPGAARLVALIVFLLRFVFPIPLLAVLVKLAHTWPGNSLSTTLAKFFNPGSVQSFTQLAKDEFREIKELDTDTLTKYAKRVTAYYAVQDPWVPNFGREEAMNIISQNGGDAHLCNEGFPHSFSLGMFPLLGFCGADGGQVHGPQMAKKIALWISTLYHPVPKSSALSKMDDDSVTEKDDDKSEYSSMFPWTWSEQDADTLVNTSPDIGRSPHRKDSIGGGVIIRKQLIRDLE